MKKSKQYNFKARYITYRLFNYGIVASLFLALTSNSNQHKIAFNNAINEVLGE